MLRRFRHPGLLALTALLALGARTSAQDAPAPDPAPPGAQDPLAPGEPVEAAPPEPVPTAPPPSDTDAFGLPRTLLGGTPVGRAYDDLVAWKDEHIPLQLGGWHWTHIRQAGPLRSDYGIPGLRGTYYYFLRFYPELETESPTFDKVGLYIDFRLRDDSDQLRTFYEANYWLWEAYAWVDTPAGRLKGGKVWKRFGLDWDGTWWGNAPYYDGHKLDPDYGVSLESAWDVTSSVKVNTFAQYFFHDDRVNGSLAGADAEGVKRSGERDTFVGRVVPTWTSGDLSIAAGLSGTVGRLLNRRQPGAPVGAEDEVIGAVAVDLTVAYGPLKVFGEVQQGWGVITPNHYASAGPSNKRATALLGASCAIGPLTLRAVQSIGWNDNPHGRHALTVVGGTLAVTNNIDIYVEYVHWEAFGLGQDSYALFENGYQLILNWRF